MTIFTPLCYPCSCRSREGVYVAFLAAILCALIVKRNQQDNWPGRPDGHRAAPPPPSIGPARSCEPRLPRLAGRGIRPAGHDTQWLGHHRLRGPELRGTVPGGGL